MKKILSITLIIILCFSMLVTVNAEETKWLVKPQYDDILCSDETGTLICVKKDDKYGYIDNTGKLIIKIEYDHASCFSNGLAYVEKDGINGYIDKSGKMVIELKGSNYLDNLKYKTDIDEKTYFYGKEFDKNYAIVNSNKGEYFVIDRDGKYVPTPNDLTIQDFNIQNDIVITGKQNIMGYGYYNIKTTDILFPFFLVSDFDNGLGIVDYGDGNIGVVNEKFEYINKQIYVENSSASISSGMIRLSEYDNNFNHVCSGYIDINGKVLIPKEYIRLGDYCEGLISAEILENDTVKVGYLNINNEFVIKPKNYEAYTDFFNGVAAVTEVYDDSTKTGNFGLIDKTGNYVLKPQFQDYLYDKNFAYAKINDLWGILDIKGLTSSNTNVVNFNPNDMPDSWAIEEITKAIESKLVPTELQNNYTQKINRKEFCDLVISLIESKSDKTIDVIIQEKGLSLNENPFTDTKNKNIIAANKLSIVNGKGNGLFDPNGNITRQEAAVMLTNTAKALGIDVTSSVSSFSDNNTIDSWAKDAVNYVASKNIMKGTNIGFEPKNNYTRQQAYLTIYRLFESIK